VFVWVSAGTWRVTVQLWRKTAGRSMSVQLTPGTLYHQYNQSPRSTQSGHPLTVRQWVVAYRLQGELCGWFRQWYICVHGQGMAVYRRTSHGGWGLRQSHYFSEKINFLGRSQQPKWKKNIFFAYSLNEKTEFIQSSDIKCPKSGIFTNNYWVGRVGQSNFAS